MNGLGIINENRIADQPEPAGDTDKFILNVPCELTSICFVPYFFLTQYCEGGSTGIHRVAFQKILADHLKGRVIDIQFCRRLEKYTTNKEDNGVKLHFRDGSVASCDVLIGADGIHSPVRHSLLSFAAADSRLGGDEERAVFLEGLKEPVWTGTVVYRALVPMDKFMQLNPQHSCLFRPQNVSRTLIIAVDCY